MKTGAGVDTCGFAGWPFWRDSKKPEVRWEAGVRVGVVRGLLASPWTISATEDLG